MITDILDGIGDLLNGGRRCDRRAHGGPDRDTVSAADRHGDNLPVIDAGQADARQADTGRVDPGESTPASGRDRPDQPGATAPDQPGATAPARPGTVQPGKLLPRIAADPALPTVAKTPSKLTGSSVRMTGLRFDGITDLHTVQGDLKVLKFSMREAVTADFLLRADGPEGRNQRYATDQLTVSGNVAFYATRFVGRLLGIKITLTPDLPLPEGIPITSPIPITFTDPTIDLAYVTSDSLTARPALALTLG
ncbi:hypothetical protein NKG94_37365 [Micromonospora sp. M12]